MVTLDTETRPDPFWFLSSTYKVGVQVLITKGNVPGEVKDLRSKRVERRGVPPWEPRARPEILAVLPVIRTWLWSYVQLFSLLPNMPQALLILFFFFNLLFQLTFIEHLLGKCVVLEASIGVG